ncbi:Tol-Pal system beta propeller repeat protein TolB [Desulfobacula toluolica]|uniref:TolB: tol-pal system, periplasmic component n=1 Tax=Desulfobacula toluolica (strain DSM 7467 / Tol2) TaxID=651182 RepID=K0NEM0_DESTT|nr:Tol-Pal system beta propeller repeat protein TolB [Desulfobacula toluolica]CCK79516.1 TolB: tol-pal system, periplasmic component [Desulfobacula toluolica Tol2]
MGLIIRNKRYLIYEMVNKTMVYRCCFVFIVFFLFQYGTVYAQEYDYINISNPFLKKTPVAVTGFKAFNGHEVEVTDGEKARRILTQALDFTGYLKTMNPVAFLSNPAESGIQLGQINFRDWTGIGAELLVTGGIIETNGKVKLKLRLFDTFNTKLLVGKVYSGSRSQIRKMIHLFCSEISYSLTGKWGVFNSKIAFVSTVNGKKEIFTCDFDGQNVKQMTFHKSICLSPSWSFDGKWLAYVSYAKGKPDIFIKNFNENKGAIVNYKGMNISPDWMPGQLKLSAALSFSGDQEIYLLTLTGEIIKRITKSWGIDVSPKFSPDGQKIVFTSKRAGTPQIYIKDIESGEVRRLTFKGLNNTSPAWSPDGKKIAYVNIKDNHINIFILDIDTGMPVQLTMNTGDNEDPAWSPDGSMITFTSTRENGVPRIFVMNASGSDQRRLLSLSGKQTQPDWSM